MDAASTASSLNATQVSMISAFGNVPTEHSQPYLNSESIGDFVESALLIDNRSQQPSLVGGGTMTPANPRSLQQGRDRCSSVATRAEVTVSGSMIADTPMPNCERVNAMQYSPEWDLSSIPERIFASERARRIAAKRKKFGPVKIALCETCGRAINARERRFPCPLHVPPPTRDTVLRIGRNRKEVLLAIALAIAKVSCHGPGEWSVQNFGRRDISLTYEVYGEALRGRSSARIKALGYSPRESARARLRRLAGGFDADSRTVWEQFGGLEILERAGIPLREYQSGVLQDPIDLLMLFYSVIPCGK